MNGFWGDPGAYLGTKTFLAETDLWGATAENPSGIGVPLYVFMAFQMMFAIITVALISGAISDRAKFAGWLLFAFGWATLVYFPVAHWVWGGGIIGAKLHALDFAGGTAVHINAGAAALAVALVLGKRLGWPREGMKPHNVPLVALGAGLLWFGWFGFNAGSELTVDSVAAPRLHQHPGRHGGRGARLDRSSSGSRTASRPWSVPRPVPSPAWSPSPRPVASSPRGRPSCSASSPVRSARSPSA